MNIINLAAEEYKKNLLDQAKKSADPNSAISLYMRMSTLSEQIWKASWMGGCEEIFWSWVHDPSTTAMDPEDRLNFQELSVKCGGWWCWGDTDYPTFMATSIWEAYVWN
jgi:hypothetical protein